MTRSPLAVAHIADALALEEESTPALHGLIGIYHRSATLPAAGELRRPDIAYRVRAQDRGARRPCFRPGITHG